MWCRQSTYDVYEAKIIVYHTPELKANDSIREYEGPWGDLLLLSIKPHQEYCVNIENFVWKLCVSPLNGVTESFEIPIPRYLIVLKISPTHTGVYSLFLFMFTPVTTRLECMYVIRRS